MRKLWGDHLHHGLWRGDEDDATAAARRMVSEIGRRLDLVWGSHVIDVGCGYGATGAQLTQEFGYDVEGVTLSSQQQMGAVEGGRVSVGDWLEGFGEDGGADGVIAMESLEHMANTERAVQHMARVLRPGGRVALGCWFRLDDATWFERFLLLDPIRKAGRLWGQTSEERLVVALGRAGFVQIECADFSQQAAPTWRACLGRGLALLRSDPSVFRRLGWRESFRYGFSTLGIMSAYHLGLLRYGVVTASH